MGVARLATLALLVRDTGVMRLSGHYLPHRFSFLAEPGLVWTNAVADGLIAASYAVLFCCLAGLLVRWRRVLELRGYLWLFASLAAFMMACATTRLMEVVTLWLPLYPLSAAVKVLCALVSVPTAIVIARRTPAISNEFASHFELVSAERLESIETLRRTESLLDRTGRLAGVGGWEYLVDGRKLIWSAEMFRIFGFPPDRQPGMDEALAFYAPESRELLFAALHRARNDGIGWSLELETQRLNGQRIWVRCVAAVDRHPKMGVRISGALQDITAQVERQETLRKTEEFLDRTGRLAKVGGWRIDMASMRVTLSEETNRILGFPPGYMPSFEEAIDMYPPESRELLSTAIEDGMREGRGWDIEVRVLPRGGEEIWVRVIGAAETVDGKPVSLTGAIQNITARVARQQALRRANERTALATESGRIGIWDWDVQTRIATWDRWTYRLHGLDMDTATEPVSDKLWTALLHADDREAFKATMTGALEGGAVADLEFRVVWLEGSIHYIHCTGRVSRDANGSASRMVGVIWDVTEQHRLAAENDRLMKLELKLRDEFLSRVSHELRSPLASIYSFTSIMADGLAGETTLEQEEYLAIVLKNASQLQAMIEDLLHITQSRDEILSISPTRTSLADAVLEAVQRMQWAADAKDLVIACHGCVDLPTVYVDPTRLRQVLIILLDNAVKFTPEGGSVDIRVEAKRADCLLIQVSDSGPGIPREDLARVFEHLYQIGASDNSGRHGLGLGLHIARDLVVRQGGKIWASSEVGIGSVFSFTVPTDLGRHMELELEKARGAVDDGPRLKLIAS